MATVELLGGAEDGRRFDTTPPLPSTIVIPAIGAQPVEPKENDAVPIDQLRYRRHDTRRDGVVVYLLETP